MAVHHERRTNAQHVLVAAVCVREQQKARLRREQVLRIAVAVGPERDHLDREVAQATVHLARLKDDAKGARAQPGRSDEVRGAGLVAERPPVLLEE